MTHLRTPRFWLLTTAALIFGSTLPANAQSALSYQSGAPTMVAAAPGLPSIPAEQIARDVTSEFNPRTGARELVAAPFDPFEEDPALAGSLRLRSADGALTVDGYRLSDGAIVEMDFYYNSPSNDPYGGRNYGDVSFINGELAPVVLRDTRILECSTRVDNVVYDHNAYYDRGRSIGIYRPYRHYAGHSGFGFGFGNSYFGPGFGAYSSRRFYGNNRSYGVRGRNSRINTGRRFSDTARNRDGADRRDRDDRGTGNRTGTVRPARTNSRRLTDRDIDERLSRVQSYGVGRSRSEVNRNTRGSSPQRAGNASQRSRIRAASPRTPQPVSQSSQSESQRPTTTRSDTRRTRVRNNSQRSETRRVEPRQAAPARTAPRRTETRRSQPTRSSNARSNSRPKKNTTQRRRISPSGTKNRINNNRIVKNFFPNDGIGSRNVVSSRSVDCAREDKLRVFIPNARLDAARFDGLTLIALDAQGGETPIYLPPNYIEGFRMAATGRVRPQGTQPQFQNSGPQNTLPKNIVPHNITPQYQTPQPQGRIETLPCPSGTTKQSDGTCLQLASSRYIYR